MNMQFEKTAGLIPAVVQDANTREVLMVAYMNPAALAQTQASGYVTFYSRSRQQLWTKGETSGNRLRLVRLWTDCDADAVLAEVEMEGDEVACHTGARSCFFQALEQEAR
ncbi:MAG TPA: phosphoribosyl-AMP cyclohydrolase [Terriglobales bacterium]|nr:phosphoribosyl-AMP cyclohydrolase [Terriglobales bacterium]